MIAGKVVWKWMLEMLSGNDCRKNRLQFKSSWNDRWDCLSSLNALTEVFFFVTAAAAASEDLKNVTILQQKQQL